MPKVLNKRRDNIPPDAVYVGRGSKWGNPFVIGTYHNGRKMSRTDAIEAYGDWIQYSDVGVLILRNHIEKLRGKDLVCWCAPLPCHADILLELANV